jgi:uncharacterized Zn-finger protein
MQMRIQTNEKPFKCSECSCSFSYSSNLQIHMRINMDVTPFKCSECAQSFSQPVNLQRHAKRHPFLFACIILLSCDYDNLFIARVQRVTLYS